MPTYPWGNLAFAAVAHRADAPRKLSDPLPSGLDWGNLQTAVSDRAYADDGSATLWVCALPNPEPERPLRALRLEARAEDAFLLCGLTLFHGRENPLRYERLRLFRLTLPEAAADIARWRLDVDLGVVARSFLPSEFERRDVARRTRRGPGREGTTARGGPPSVRRDHREPRGDARPRRHDHEPALGVRPRPRRGRARGGGSIGRREGRARRAGQDVGARPCRGRGHRPAHTRASGLSLARGALHSALRARHRDQRRMVPGLRRRREAHGHAVRLRGRDVPGGAAGGRGLRRADEGLRVRAGAPEAPDRGGTARAGDRDRPVHRPAIARLGHGGHARPLPVAVDRRPRGPGRGRQPRQPAGGPVGRSLHATWATSRTVPSRRATARRSCR